MSIGAESADVMSGASVKGRRQGPLAAVSRQGRPLTSYHLLIGATALLVAIGLVMVLSTSSAAQLEAGDSPYGQFAHQLLGVLVGLPMMWVLSRTPPKVFRAVAYPLLLATMGGLLMVLAFGVTVAGAERWIQVAGFQVQPSEFAKFAFLLWGADLLARKEHRGQLGDWRTLLFPLLPGAAIVAMLVMLGHDIGTTFLLLVILLALLWVIGTPGRLYAGLLGLMVFALLLLVVTTKYANSRLSGYLNSGGSPTGPNMQSIQGKWAIGSGGFFGVGLGASQEKWGWVPNSSTDFIFAILGEELGLIGTVCVVFLYGGLAYAGLRVARRVSDPFMRLAAAGATAWITTQALVNICAVLGLLPITGVPLPLMSAGLSSLLATLAAIGMLLSFARCEPAAREALIGARGRVTRMRPGRSEGAARLAEPGVASQREAAGISRQARRSRYDADRPSRRRPDSGERGSTRPGTERRGAQRVRSSAAGAQRVRSRASGAG